ncbi:helix-turn-helix transcriptional regulator [Fusobacterium sp. PH5-44]|uniref:helix-turn-helix transcriptional regulator n=1 Tax=unclassified Fusobacterium TaxID=2648384 RepID=UPI003D1A125C
MKIERLIGILSILLQKEKVTAPFLAEKFEVSRRTINRDIDDLCSAGIPIITTQGQNGGISIMEGFKIDKTLLTSNDMQSILVGLQSLNSISETTKYQQLMNKLSLEKSSITHNNSIIIDLSSWDKSKIAPKFELLKKAIENKNNITFDYYSPNGQSFRKIEPYLLTYQWTSWYIWGFCTQKSDFRLFKLNRMHNINTSIEVFSPRELPEFNINKSEIFSKEIQIIAIFDSNMKWRLIDEYSMDSFVEQEDGTLLFKFCFMDKDSIFRWLLSYGNSVKLIAPKELIPEFIALTKSIIKKYQT